MDRMQTPAHLEGLVAHQGMVHRWAAAQLRGEGAPDCDAGVFLADSGPPRHFWARRQCHETTVHAVDALAAELGRRPVADETWISSEVALDGIDELLTGFLPRPVSRLRAQEPMRIGVRPDEGDAAWLVRVGPEQPVTTRHGAADAEPAAADVVLAGPAVALYLTLWNRSDEVAPRDREPTTGDDWWRGAEVRWT